MTTPNCVCGTPCKQATLHVVGCPSCGKVFFWENEAWAERGYRMYRLPNGAEVIESPLRFTENQVVGERAIKPLAPVEFIKFNLVVPDGEPR